jgi:hypothetical protein
LGICRGAVQENARGSDESLTKNSSRRPYLACISPQANERRKVQRQAKDDAFIVRSSTSGRPIKISVGVLRQPSRFAAVLSIEDVERGESASRRDFKLRINGIFVTSGRETARHAERATASTLVSQHLVKADACQLESNSGSGSRPSRLLFALQVFDFRWPRKTQLKEEFKRVATATPCCP